MPGSRSLRVQLFPPAGRPQSDVANNSANRLLVFGPEGSGVSFSVYGARFRYSNVPMDVQTARGLSSSTWPEWPFSAYEVHRPSFAPSAARRVPKALRAAKLASFAPTSAGESSSSSSTCPDVSSVRHRHARAATQISDRFLCSPNGEFPAALRTT